MAEKEKEQKKMQTNQTHQNNENHEKSKHNSSHIDVIANDNICSKHGKVCKEVEYLEMAQRLKAEFENYKKRNAEISNMSYQNGIINTVSKLLPAIDSFQQAKSNINDESILSGIDLIYNQIIAALNGMGVEKIDCLGNVFDPNLHNAVLVGNEPSYGEDVVLEEYQSGFKLGDKVIRPSSVKVNKIK